MSLGTSVDRVRRAHRLGVRGGAMGKLSCRAIWAFSCLPTAGKRDIQEAESRSRTVQIASEPSLADPGTQGGPRLSGVEEPKGRLNRLRGVSPAKRDGAPCKAPVCGDAIQSASMDRPTRFGEGRCWTAGPREVSLFHGEKSG